jgi:hypothetical protein
VTARHAPDDTRAKSRALPRRPWGMGALIGVFGITTSCAYVEYHRYEWERALAAVASKDLDCPRSELHISPTNGQIIDGTDLPVRERVEGCGRQHTYTAGTAAYVRDDRVTPSKSYDSGWCGSG